MRSICDLHIKYYLHGKVYRFYDNTYICCINCLNKWNEKYCTSLSINDLNISRFFQILLFMKNRDECNKVLLTNIFNWPILVIFQLVAKIKLS